MKHKFRACSCNLSDEAIYEDIASVVQLTGNESPWELDMLHESIFHSEDYYDWDDEDFYGTEHVTAKELETLYWDKKFDELRCPICPPNKGDNRKSWKKHGTKKSKHKNKHKKQGRAVKQLTYDGEESCSNFAKRLKKA